VLLLSNKNYIFAHLTKHIMATYKKRGGRPKNKAEKNFSDRRGKYNG
jgi:hypothetical protein